ncbi:hypothetical protein [Crateriforma conspicua]|uniref:Uncharacterized protein n=1 Tax=Crateriforma conspicua TaxID=2527996 RepID=A0A5C5XYX2_9PLAN|nr:hypothetical protein [Crateriforma conspicua]TWT68577.1 hypothetical protein Pan14r_08230 [Crateriforma conspicua]
MLLLLLMTCWIRRPMHFAGPRKRTIVLVSTMLTVCSPIHLLDQQATAQTPAITAPSVGASSVFATGASPTSSQYDANNDADLEAPDESRRTIGRVYRLREGTRIPPTRGRVAKLGRRWVFIPENVDANPPASGTGSQVNRSQTITETIQSSRGLLTRTTSRTSAMHAPPEQQRTVPRRLPQMICVENLMLQRIVEAINDDVADDQWSITGQITEFREENRLILLSAQRASQ